MSAKKVGCVFTQISFDSPIAYKRYDGLAKCAVNSFKKFHPDAEVVVITNDNAEDYLLPGTELNAPASKLIFTYDVAKRLGLTKVMCFGVDTITCARLDEFLDDDTTDILMTLNYPMPEKTQYWETPILPFMYPNGTTGHDSANINADVVCFNNMDALKRCIDLTAEHLTQFAEQGALNEMAWSEKSFSFKIVDFPYPLSKVVYNARSKGVFGTNMCNKTTPQSRWKVIGDKLFTEDNKQIKVWHYIEGLGCQDKAKFEVIVNSWIFELFNDETKKFFEEYCECGDFFKKPYKIEVECD